MLKRKRNKRKKEEDENELQEKEKEKNWEKEKPLNVENYDVRFSNFDGLIIESSSQLYALQSLWL